MTNQDMLKIAFVRGLRESIDSLEITTPDAAFVKEAIFRKLWGGLKELVGKGVKKGIKEAPKLVPPVKPGAGASAEELARYAKANTEYAAKKLQQSGYNPLAGTEEAAGYAKKIGPEAEKWLKTMEEAGNKGMLGALSGAAGYLLPAAAGAGLGYAANGRQGALAGAGLGLGARLGTGGLLKRLREARGFTSALGKEAPGLAGKMMGTAAGKKALIAGGALGAGGGALGYMAGRATQPPEKPWYSGMGLGLTPQQTQELSQAAVPLLSERLGLDPSVVEALGAQYGIIPMQAQQAMPEEPMAMEQPAEYYPDEATQQVPMGPQYY